MPESQLALAGRAEQEIKTLAEGVEVALGIKEISPAFSERRDNLIVAARTFEKPPTNEEEQSLILVAQRDLAKLRNELVKQASALKAPLNNARGKIIEIEKAEVAKIEKEEMRLQGYVQNYQQKLMDDRRKAEREAERERQRIADEQAAAERIRQQAEQARLLAEQKAAEAERMKGREAEKARLEAEKAAAEATKLAEDAYDAELAAETAMAISVPLPEVQAKEVLDYEVLGKNTYEQHDNLVKFAAVHPELVKIEIKRRDLIERLNSGSIAEAPGIKIIQKLSTLR